jgi:hypothetical protein
VQSNGSIAQAEEHVNAIGVYFSIYRTLFSVASRCLPHLVHCCFSLMAIGLAGIHFFLNTEQWLHVSV